MILGANKFVAMTLLHDSSITLFWLIEQNDRDFDKCWARTVHEASCTKINPIK